MNNAYIEFTISFFHKLNLVTNILKINEPLPNDLDLGLRKSIIGETEMSLQNMDFLPPDFIEHHIIYFSADKYKCHYIFIPLPTPDNDTVMVSGPYLIENTSIVKTTELCKNLNIPSGLHAFMHQYFATLPCLPDTSVIENYIATVGEALYGTGNYHLEYIHQTLDRNTTYVNSTDTSDNEEMMKRMEYRYSLEQKVIDAISRGDFNSAMRASSDQALRNIDNRSSNTLRSKKNNLLAFNTVCRKGAEKGGVHPIFLDEMSRQMAIKIENMIVSEQDKNVHREILKSYCTMVQQNSTSGYSPTMQRALIHISQHLFDTDLTLQSTSEALVLNKTYLANLFKKETGDTFTAYVNGRRINHAIFLLNTSEEQIQSIASECGIPDVTYFTRIFKEAKGMTPSSYRKMIKQQS